MPATRKRNPKAAAAERARRQARLSLGLRAEWIAAALLIAKGYRILARRFIVPGGEIDLVARRGDAIAFVEVKARGDLDGALMAIDPIKRRRIARAVRAWLARNPSAMQATLRGDAVLVAPRRLPRHVVAAFDLSLE